MTEPSPAPPIVDVPSTGRANVLAVSGTFDATQPYTEIWMADGQVVRLSTSVLLHSLEPENLPSDQGGGLALDNASPTVIPLIEERFEVGKRTVPTGLVRLHKTVQEYTQQLNEVLAVRTFDVERRAINQPVDTPPPVRQEGNTTIYSLVEEQLILTKQLILKEEVRIVQRDTERRDTQTVSLHKEHLVVERSDPNQTSSTATHKPPSF